ncbi:MULTISPECIES: hypothetical protein [unclassified Erwinia]|uniref:hypothetical protein n=1 Tax=unclassified Erwinia TaxID=2622719 RepID=UPI000C1885AB|nr:MULTISPECIES: hypothetical protein [unclassified Erwinia]PIJ49192.1 hypothetical protein BV501_13780 [Erwinia sp. OAMSP11]PIJ79901.1 hypothetical protein BLD47_12570 [Erwinia sp. OLCASP19]PIJ81069.1 hypothetical protein BLD46_13380 [Erwinia sp. OLMTSP26]PIJ93125.1 hypothetical protein BL249_05225 [Erwinia sp. OLFS4]
MVGAQINFLVVGHHSRRNVATVLAESLNASLLIDEADHGAAWNHRRAIEWAATQSGRVVILEDDAMPVAGFNEEVAAWLNRFPDDLLSFYLGTGRPPQWQSEIKRKLASNPQFITLPTLIHGVCYSIPRQHVQRILDKWPQHLAADYAVGRAWGGDVIYPAYSLVDHADGESVERHPDGERRTEVRRAWQLAS